MESHEEDAMGSNYISSTSTNSTGDFSPSAAAVVKGKRTKRKRALLPTTDTATSSTSFSSNDCKSAIAAATTEEDEDMANCLILLARGGSLVPPPPQEKLTSRRFAEAATTTAGRAGFYVYECKTCNKCFPSFQALGGHCASHKKHRMAAVSPTAEERRHVAVAESDLVISMSSFVKPVSAVLPAGNSSKGLKVHECSVCGAEFSSGQALGGHMRRHRPAAPPEAAAEDAGKKSKHLLSLDLNMPAPLEEEHREEFPAAATSGLTFTAGKRTMVFSAALVDCYY